MRESHEIKSLAKLTSLFIYLALYPTFSSYRSLPLSLSLSLYSLSISILSQTIHFPLNTFLLAFFLFENDKNYGG